MHIRKRIQEQNGTPNVYALGVRRRAHHLVQLFSCSLLSGVTVFLAACGSGTGPPTDDPIPEQLYEVALANSTNDCGSGNLVGFQMFAFPLNDGSEVQGLLESGVTSKKTGDVLSFSVPIPLDGDTVVTLGAEWTFAEDRHTFAGPTTLAVSFGGPVVCTFTLASNGRHFVNAASDARPPLPSEPSAAAIVRPSEPALAGEMPRALSASTWGLFLPPGTDPTEVGSVRIGDVVCTSQDAFFPRTVAAPQIEVTSAADHHQLQFHTTRRGDISVEFFRYYFPGEQKTPGWHLDHSIQQSVTIHGRRTFVILGSPEQPGVGDFVWSQAPFVPSWNPPFPGFYSVQIRVDWVLPYGDEILGTAWVLSGAQDYFDFSSSSYTGSDWCNVG